MKETKEVKVKFSTVICIILIILLIAGCGLLYYFGFVKKNEKISNLEKQKETLTTKYNEAVSKLEESQNANKNISQPINNNETSKYINEINESDEIVYTKYKIETGGGNNEIPFININSTYASQVNQKMEDYYKEFEESGKQVEFMSYDYYINNNILSLVIYEGVAASYEYEIYNIDIYNGNIVTNSEILKTKQITVEEFENNLPKVFGEFFEEYYKQMDKEDEFYKEQYNRTIAKENCTINNQIFLGEEGEINVIGTIYALAGGNAYAHIIKYK